MRYRHLLLAAAAAVSLASFGAEAKTLRFSFQGDVGTMDPYGLNETFTLAFQGNIYEGLIRRTPDLAVEPALAESWEMLEPTRWRFHLRKGVKFHNGNDFTADDVLFSAERARKDGSDLKTRLAGVVDVVKVDDHTVDFVTEAPNPTLIAEWGTWYIMDKEWAEANGATEPTNVSKQGTNYANLHANGTGPFRLVSREPDVKTVAEANPDWWDEPEHNLTEVVYQPIASDATRVAALLSGELDMIYGVPLQDIDRLERTDGVKVMAGPELRTIFLGMDQARDELLYSDVKGKNPFKDVRVRQAVNLAIDRNAIQRAVMRGQSRPAESLAGPGINGFPEHLEVYPHDPAKAKALLAEAGYPDGFKVTLDCPNDRYVNDESICQAVVAMLGKVGVTVDLLAQTKSKYFAKVLKQGGYDTSFYLLGWTPASYDSLNAIYSLVHTRQEDGAGLFNLGGYSNARVDELSAAIKSEADEAKRDAMIAEAWQIIYDEYAYVPLHQQSIAWGVRDNVSLALRADNEFYWRHVRID